MKLLLATAASVCFLLLSCAPSVELDSQFAALDARVAAVEQQVARIHTHERRPIDEALATWYRVTAQLISGETVPADARVVVREAVAYDPELTGIWAAVGAGTVAFDLFEAMLWERYLAPAPSNAVAGR